MSTAPSGLPRSRRAFLALVLLVAAAAMVAAVAVWEWRDRRRGGTRAAFRRGPYLTGTGAREATLRWSVPAGAAVEVVARGPDGAEHRSRDGRLGGLEPDTRYAWTATLDGGAEQRGTFHTAPVDDVPVRFAVIGDYGSGNEHEVAVGRQILAGNPRFVVTAGDNSYLVAAATLLDRNIFRPLAPLLRHAPLYICVGDHDRFFPGPAALLGAFDQPVLQDLRHGPVQVVVCGDEADEQALAFVRRALADPGPKVRFVVQHHTVQSGEELAAVAREGGAAALLTGHLHRYERRVVDGVLSFTVGTGGQGPGSEAGTPRSADAAVSLLDYGHLVVDVEPGARVRYRFVDEHGRVLDEHATPLT